MDATTALLLFLAIAALAFVAARLRPARSGGDAEITAAVNAALATALSREYPLATLQVDVKTFDGVVILGGFVREYEQVKRVVEIARGIPGVKSVDNRVSIRSDG